jgi:hypothetical protein
VLQGSVFLGYDAVSKKQEALKDMFIANLDIGLNGRTLRCSAATVITKRKTFILARLPHVIHSTLYTLNSAKILCTFVDVHDTALSTELVSPQ